jgi:hypothetical protein
MVVFCLVAHSRALYFTYFVELSISLMLILSPYFNGRLNTLMLAMTTGDTSPCTGGVSPVIKMWGVQLGLAFVLREKNTHNLISSVHIASMVDNLVLKEQYFWTLQKTKCYSSVGNCSSLSRTQKSSKQNLLYQEMSTRTGSNLVSRIPINFYSYICNNIY